MSSLMQTRGETGCSLIKINQRIKSDTLTRQPSPSTLPCLYTRLSFLSIMKNTWGKLSILKVTSVSWIDTCKYVFFANPKLVNNFFFSSLWNYFLIIIIKTGQQLLLTCSTHSRPCYHDCDQRNEIRTMLRTNQIVLQKISIPLPQRVF